jgi:hypothetical protein
MCGAVQGGLCVPSSLPHSPLKQGSGQSHGTASLVGFRIARTHLDIVSGGVFSLCPGFAKAFMLPLACSSSADDSRAVYRIVRSQYLLL